MAYGGSTITADDRIGASLLRPRRDWIEGTGTAWGRVLLEDGNRASHVHVLATLRDQDGRLVESIGRFTNRQGDFAIGGLAPGSYVLLVRPILGENAQRALLAFATLDIRDSLRANPVRIEAGKRTGPIFLTVRRGRR